MIVDDTASAHADAKDKLRALDKGTRFLVEQSLAVRSVGDTTKLINAGLGPKVTYNQVKRLRDALRKSSKPLFVARPSRAGQDSASGPPVGFGEERAAHQAAERGSRALALAQLKAGQHILPLDAARDLARRYGVSPLAVRPSYTAAHP